MRGGVKGREISLEHGAFTINPFKHENDADLAGGVWPGNGAGVTC